MAVHTPVKVTLLHELTKQFCVSAFASPNNGAPNGNAVGFHAPKDVVDDFLDGSSSDFLAATRAVRLSNSGPQ